MNTKLTKELFEQVKTLREQGLSFCKISKIVHIDRNIISIWLKTNPSELKFKETLLIDQSHKKCCRCGKIKDISEFQRGRRGTSKEYIFDYCNQYRRHQIYENLNSDFNKWFKQKYNRWKTEAKRKGDIFTITFSELNDIYLKQNKLCFYSGILMTWGVNKGFTDRNIISIDKVIPEKGYISGNVVLCTNRFNTIKNDLSLEELNKYIPAFYDKIMNCEWLKL